MSVYTLSVNDKFFTKKKVTIFFNSDFKNDSYPNPAKWDKKLNLIY